MLQYGGIQAPTGCIALRFATFATFSAATVALVAGHSSVVLAQAPSAPRIAERVGSAFIVVGSGPALTFDFKGNTGSSLTYEWIVVIDSSLGLVFEGPAGARSSGSPANPEIKIDADVRALVPIAAYEIRVVMFDVWRRHTATLSYSRLQDIKVGDKKALKRTWSGFTPSESRIQLTSIAYISKVRYQDGRTVVADPTSAIRAAQAISASITGQDLEPTSKATEETQTATEP